MVAFLPEDLCRAATRARKFRGEHYAERAYGKCNSARVSMETVYSSKHTTAGLEIQMASTSTETVALALRELAMSPEDQDGLADFLTDYFGSSESDELGK